MCVCRFAARSTFACRNILQMHFSRTIVNLYSPSSIYDQQKCLALFDTWRTFPDSDGSCKNHSLFVSCATSLDNSAIVYCIILIFMICFNKYYTMNFFFILYSIWKILNLILYLRTKREKKCLYVLSIYFGTFRVSNFI